jgi:hypothetical protein
MRPGASPLEIFDPKCEQFPGRLIVVVRFGVSASAHDRSGDFAELLVVNEVHLMCNNLIPVHISVTAYLERKTRASHVVVRGLRLD